MGLYRLANKAVKVLGAASMAGLLGSHVNLRFHNDSPYPDVNLLSYDSL
jgi:hypothetical protein